MAEIKSIYMNKNKIELTLSINKNEHKLLNHHTANLILLPVENDSFTQELTTGKLGNSNRIMLPKRMLESVNINELKKKVPSNTFTLNEDVFLLIKLKSSQLGIPKFKEDEYESHNRD